MAGADGRLHLPALACACHTVLITSVCMGRSNPFSLPPPAAALPTATSATGSGSSGAGPLADLPSAALPARRRLLQLGGAALGSAVTGGGLLTSGCASVAPTGPAPGAVVPFSTSDRIGSLPEGWQLHPTRPDRPVTSYRLEHIDARIALHAQALNATSGVRCDVDIDLAERPWLRWEWRVDQIHASATVADDDLDDSPARVVLGFAGDLSRLSLRDRLFADQVELFTGQVLPFATLCYVWDGRAAPETVLPYARSSRIRYLVVESGSAGTGHWHSYRRNVVADYQLAFGEAPGRLQGVGVLTDSDDLKGGAEAWYGDLVIE